MITVAMHRGLRQRQFRRDRMPCIGRPHRLTAIPSGHSGDGHLQDIDWRRIVHQNFAFGDKFLHLRPADVLKPCRQKLIQAPASVLSLDRNKNGK